MPATQADIEARLADVEPDVEVLLFEPANASTMRLVIDSPEGITLATCERVTGHLRDLLLETGLEVSSPGPSRPLTKPDHYRRFLGRRVRVRTGEAIEGRNEFKGELVDADDRAVALSGDWGTVTIPHERIRRSNLVPEPMQVPHR
jgi:ribosome maturation factor RimP